MHERVLLGFHVEDYLCGLLVVYLIHNVAPKMFSKKIFPLKMLSKMLLLETFSRMLLL